MKVGTTRCIRIPQQRKTTLVVGWVDVVVSGRIVFSVSVESTAIEQVMN